jgi:hypothetical protein
MTILAELDLGDGVSLLLESGNELAVPRGAAVPPVPFKRNSAEGAVKARFEPLADCLRNFTTRAVAAVREADADVERVSLRFGVSVVGENAVPYITQGAEAAMLTVTVECRGRASARGG